MADLGLYFGDEDEEQLEQENKALSYLVLATDQDDAFDPVDTENLLAQMSAESLISHRMELDEETNVVQLLSEPNLTALEKVQLLSQSQYHFHRSFLAREITTLLPQMEMREAIGHVIPIIKDFSMDNMDAVREALAAQLDKIVLYFFNNTIIDHDLSTEPVDDEQEDPLEDEYPGQKRPLPHGIFTAIFLNLLLDQVSGIAHQTRVAVAAVSENVSEEIMESEMLNGVIAGLKNLYNAQSQGESYEEPEENQDQYQNEFGYGSTSAKEEEERKAELAKMLVVVLLTTQAKLLGPVRCTNIVIPTLEKFMNNSEFYVRKEIVMALGTLCSIVEPTVVVDQLLPIYDAFVQDDTWHIRRACCTILAPLIAALPTMEMKASKAEEVYGIFSTDVSYSVRNSIMEVLGEVIAKFEKEQVPDSLLNHFLSMGQHPINEYERAVMCAFSFPAVILTAGRSKWELMKPVYMRLAGTFRSPIRRSLACSLHEVAKILGPDLAGRDLAVAFSDCLVAEDEVKEGVLGHVVEFLAALSEEHRSKALEELHHAWTDLERSSNWRLRDSLAGHLPALCELAEAEDLVRFLMPLCVKACTDSVSTIRESGVMTFPALWEASDRVGPVPVPEHSEDEEDEEEEEKDAQVAPTAGEDVEMQDMTDASITNDICDESTSKPTSSSASENIITKMTTLKEQVILQTADFGIHGTFRSRVVAVQIIQSLLDHGITIEEFEQHFMPLMIEHLAVDSVANVRIWTARVVTWIVENGFYGDAPVCEPIQELLLRLQQDSDRDVRIYSGGPAELNPPLKKKKKSSKKSKKEGKTSATKKKVSAVFHQNPKHGEPATMEEEEIDIENVDDEEGEQVQVQVLFQKDEDESNSGEEEEDDEEDDSSDESSEEEEVEQRTTITTRVAKTSWDDVPDAEDEDIDIGDEHSEYELSPRRSILAEDEDEDEDEEGIADRVVPFSTLTANGASPLDVEMEEPEMAAEEGSLETTPSSSAWSPQTSQSTSPERSGPSESAFPPLSPSSPSTISTAQMTPSCPVAQSTLTYAGVAKAKQLSSNLSSLTSFSQANIPEPSVASTLESKTASNADNHSSNDDNEGDDDSEEEDEVVFQGRRQWLTSRTGHHLVARHQNTELLTSFPSLSSPPSSSNSSSSPSSSSALTSASSSSAVAAVAAAATLPFSYASVVASGAPLHSAFSQPLQPVMASSSSSAYSF
ncbi:serine/threonine-protein phosphatase 4 regulatory subunit 1 [Entomortierella parvispora]|uniref:Serine/threonine-protein phosphatase 4 regulatory subunit 1 n=1 Tax=Entomortierella parvispora TaxID=205924 RepID=A0A9P3LYN3_9FUNG|nr:serine/threonine-protein phosphatase 4 regulatory subunit 1 [Entomortierella parvispora]